MKLQKNTADLLPKLKAMALADRAMFEKGMKAFVSYIQAYAKHECNLIFRLKGNLKHLMVFTSITNMKGFPGGASGKEPACQCWRHKRHGLDSWVGKIPWRRKWQPTPVFLPGESHGQRSLAGYSPWSHRVGYQLAAEHLCWAQIWNCFVLGPCQG